MFYEEIMLVFSYFCRTLKNGTEKFRRSWIGLVNINKEDNKNHENNWYWIDDEKAIKGKTNWNNGQPNNRRSDQYCAEVRNILFKFNDQNCMNKLIAFCEID